MATRQSRDRRIAALFAGAGGLDYGLKRAGFRTVLAADNDAAAQAVLKARFAKATISGDVGLLADLPNDIDLVTAGFPCQDLSMAGRKSGLKGAKSSAIDHLFDLLTASRAPAVLIENVYFMLHLDKGAAMSSLVARLELLGYRWAYRVVNSNSFGLPQRRRRVFLLALQNGEPGRVLFADDAGPSIPVRPSIKLPIGFYWTEGASGHGMTSDAIPPLKAGSTIGIASPPAVLFPDGRVVRPTIETAERLQGLPRGWTSPAAAAGYPRARWKLVGNAVSAPVATWLGKRIIKPGEPLGISEKLSKGDPWPMAAFGENGQRWLQEISERPLSMPVPSLLEFRETEWEPLSARALNGFIGRARGSNLKYPRGFLSALERAARAQRSKSE